jgi:hypothetical protein
MDQSEHLQEPRHLAVPLGTSISIYEHIVRLAQTVHQSCSDTNTASKWTDTRFRMPTSPGSSIGCVQNDFRACGTLRANRAPILHQDEHYLQTDQNEHPLEPRHLGVPSGGSKRIPKPMVPLAQTIHLYCTDTNIVSKWTKMRFHMTHVT